MQLSSEQENAYLSRYAHTLRTFTTGFCARFVGYGRLDAEDCFQEVCIAFLAHLRRVDSEEDVLPLPFYDFRHALCVAALSSMPCSAPKRTTSFSKMFTNHAYADSVDFLMENGEDITGQVAGEYGDVDEKLSFSKFLSEITPDEQKMLSAMAETGSMVEAGRLLGVHKSTVSRRLSALKSKYLEDCKK